MIDPFFAGVITFVVLLVCFLWGRRYRRANNKYAPSDEVPSLMVELYREHRREILKAMNKRTPEDDNEQQETTPQNDRAQ